MKQHFFFNYFFNTKKKAINSGHCWSFEHYIKNKSAVQVNALNHTAILITYTQTDTSLLKLK